MRAAADRAITALLRAQPRTAASHATTVRRRAFIEPSPYLARDLWHDAARLLTARGWDVHLATRFQLTDAAEPSVAAPGRLGRVPDAGLTLIDASGPETPPGAALIIGACAATGRPVLAADPGGWWTFADGREPNWRNLMIQYAISGRFTTISELAAMVDSR